MMQSGALPWLSTMGTNIAIGVLAALLIWTVGIVPFLLVHLPIVLIAGSAGVWLFYAPVEAAGLEISLCRHAWRITL